MIKNIHIIAGTLVLAAVSCENTVPAVMNPEAETVIIAHIGSGANENSRTAIDPTEYRGGHVGILWTPDDAIGVFGGTVRNARFGCNATEPSGRASFSGSCAEPEHAYYPYSAANDGADPSAIAGHLPAVQSYDSATGLLDGDYKYGRRRAATADGGAEFDFDHIFALFRFNVEATGTPLSGECLKSVSLELPQGRVLAGDFTFNIADGTYQFTGNTSNTVTVQWADTPGLASGSVHTAYMSVAPDLHADDAVVITVLTDRHKATFTKHVAYDLAPNSVYTFDLSLSDFAEDMVVEEVPAEAEEETANCYMVNTTGEHSFLATQIGNGDKGIIPGAGFHVATSKIAPKSAKVLWQDVEGFVDEGSVRLGADGRVYYTAAKNTGNALIAVYSGEGCTGDILWSWHIWGVGDTMPQDDVIMTKSGSEFRIMDRNLGAFPSTEEERLQATRTDEVEHKVLNCMLYQWGRKDPIPNSDVYWVDGVRTDISASYPVWQPATQSEATIAASVARPGYIINKPADADWWSWLGADNHLLWGDSFQKGVTDGGWTDVKTIYDPSPVGYRVANSATYTRFITVDKPEIQMKGVTSYRTVDGVNIPSLTYDYIQCIVNTEMQGTTERWLPKGIHRDRIGFAYNSTDNKDKIYGYGIYFKQTADDAKGGYYPMGGSRFPNPVGKRNDYAKNSYLWSSASASNNYNAMSMHLYHFYWLTGSGNYKEPDKGLSGTGYSAGVVGTVKTKYQSRYLEAYGVRCVRDDSAF